MESKADKTVRRIEHRTDGVRVNLGCGLNAFPGWVNIDRSWGPWLRQHRWTAEVLTRIRVLAPHQAQLDWSAEVRRCDVTRGLPFASSTVDVVYSVNMLQRIPRGSVPSLLRDCFRVLRPGGLLRLGVPDLTVAVSRYTAAKRECTNDAAEELSRYIGFNDRRYTELPHRLALAMFAWPTAWAYDCDSLTALLVQAGFGSVVQCELGGGRCPDLAYETQPIARTERLERTLFVEADR